MNLKENGIIRKGSCEKYFENSSLVDITRKDLVLNF
jgi:hypothetical protein